MVEQRAGRNTRQRADLVEALRSAAGFRTAQELHDELKAGGARIGLTHEPGSATGREERLVARFPGCAAVVYGHTHRPHIYLHDGVWILNPGSPTERRRAPERTMLELTVAGEELMPTLVSLGP